MTQSRLKTKDFKVRARFNCEVVFVRMKLAVLSVLAILVVLSGTVFAETRTTASSRNTSVSAAINSAVATAASTIPALPNSTKTAGSAASSTPGMKAAATLCTESDGGLNYNEYGTASGIYADTGTYEKWLGDYCIGNNTVVERYCGQDGYVHDAKYKCLMGYKCEGGACVSTGGPTCMGLGESCSDYFCCYPLACKQHGSQYLCYNATLPSGSAPQKSQVYAPTAKQLNITEYEMPPDEAYGTAYLNEMTWFAYGMDNKTMPYYVEIALYPEDNDGSWFSFPEYSNVWGNVDGISFVGKTLNNLEIRFSDGAHALAFFNTVNGMGKKSNAKLNYISHDCDYISYIDMVYCTVGTDPRDSYKLVGYT
jgi:hypothetical protein